MNKFRSNAHTAFITRSGSQLMLDGSVYRFAGANIYWLGMDDESQFRVDDALDTVVEMGGTVVRTFAALTVGSSKSIQPTLGVFNETALIKLDQAVKSAADRGIRLIIPFVSDWGIYGGTSTYTTWRSLPSANDFYTDVNVINDFKVHISKILNRVNTLTGIAYKNDPTILAWETGNELHLDTSPRAFPPTAWTQTIADYIKGIDANHLVMDGSWVDAGINSAALSLTNVDMYTNHYYPMNDSQLNSDASAVNTANKAFYVGEYGWNTGTNLSSFLSSIESGAANTTVGDTFWSMFPHSETNGYVQHYDTFPLHYPGGTGATERTHIQMLRDHAYVMRGVKVPEHGIPKAPLITNVTASGGITWRGTAIADTYTVERSTVGETGPWTVICNQCATDNDTPWVDSTAPLGSVWYRVKGHNLSNIAGDYSPVYAATIRGK